MNKVSRTITGGVIIVLAILQILFLGILNSTVIDYFSIATGTFLLCIGIVIIFNKKEDDIEQIKGREEKKK